MKNNINYQSYEGSNKHILVLADESDAKKMNKMVNKLINNHIRTAFYCLKHKGVLDSEKLVQKIKDANLVIAVISNKATERLLYKNIINYVISNYAKADDKKIIYINLDKNNIRISDEGMALQLETYPRFWIGNYDNFGALCDALLHGGKVTQDLAGDDAQVLKKTHKWIRAGIIAFSSAIVIVLFSAGGYFFYHQYYSNTLRGQISVIEHFDVLNLDGQKASFIRLLEDKDIDTLIASNMRLEDISPLEYVNVKNLDISYNPKLDSIEPISNNENIQVLYISQDMLHLFTQTDSRYGFSVVLVD